MTCRACKGTLERTVTDPPFKLTRSSIVIFKSLPVLQCTQCNDTELEDATMARVEELLSTVNSTAELQVIPFAP